MNLSRDHEIQLTNPKNHIIDTSKLGNHLHGPYVDQFTEEFCDYVGAKYGCPMHSATAAIEAFFSSGGFTVNIPTILPPVVANAILSNPYNKISFNDNFEWIGRDYLLYSDKNGSRVFDSAHSVQKGICKTLGYNDAVIYSFYPTKVLGSIDGGMVVSNNKEMIDKLKCYSMNGVSGTENEYVGRKSYMNSVQAYVALQNLRTLDERKERLTEIRKKYNSAFLRHNTSDHLYRINIDNRDQVRHHLLDFWGIQTGIHYKPLHLMPLYKDFVDIELPKSEEEGRTTLSLPFHDGLTDDDVARIIEAVQCSQ